MQGLILAGGKGTRLRPLTIDAPKPMVPLGNRPLLRYQIDILKLAGIEDIIFSLNYKPDKIQEVVGNGEEYGVNIKYVVEPQPMGTAGAYKFAENLITGTTVVLNGDALINLNISDLIKYHQQRNALATIVLAEVDDPVGFGLVKLDKDKRVLEFLEKPQASDPQTAVTRTVNAGTYVLEPEVLKNIPRDQNHSFEYGVFPGILSRKQEFFGYVSKDSYWLDVGNPERYLKANQDLIKGKVIGLAPQDYRSHSEISESSKICEHTIVGRDSVVGHSTKIVDSVIGDKVFIADGSTIENSVICSNTRIGKETKISDAVIGENCRIGENSFVGNGTVLGNSSSLTDYSKV